MDNKVFNTDTDKFEYLMSNLLSGTISENEERSITEMLDADPANKKTYMRMARTRAVSFIPVLEKEKQQHYNKFIATIRGIQTKNTSNLYIRNMVRVAAMLIIAVSTFALTFYSLYKFDSNREVAYTETIVPMGSYTKIILSDGTVAMLNSGSTFKYDENFGKRTRTVTLSGEGYFEVTKDAGRPFIVNIDDIEVKVLGTTFNVRSYHEDSQVEVNLIEGKVYILNKKDADAEGLILTPNEKMIYSKEEGNMITAKAECYKSAQWTVGKLHFENASFEKIVRDLERKFDVKIDIGCDVVKNELFTGVLDLNQPLNVILDYLDVDKKLKKTYQGKSITISKRI
ncbi:MAG: FecR family protein [Paludibacter sp.]|jgi:ferric-dicitrate binding protein FerR (iron transport regulator)|nr:FecR family protein [Paludibacter sp.]